jgi:hypothetical protein
MLFPTSLSSKFDVFFPTYANRTTAKRTVQRQFNYILDRAGLKDAGQEQKHTVYSLRHTAICKRILHSKGQVNIYTLAKVAGTSVEQIERFYTKYLPIDERMAENLQMMG